MNFGLGLVLSFTNNATAGINSAVNSLNTLTQTAENASASLDQMASLSALSVVTDQLGSAFLNTGNAILSTMGQIIGKVNETGGTLMMAERQLDALYASSGKSGKEVISQIQEYAETSMFEFENLIPAVTSLKSVGIEAFDSITSSMGNSKNNLLDYASALASFAPQMKNAYGTGINAAIGAMREFIAEGNALSLKRGAGLDITGILGEDKGATIEERTRQVADLIEKLGMLDMVETMKNAPQTMLSNMGDVLFKLMGMISDSGVYDTYSAFITKIAGYVMSIPDEELQSIASVIGSTLTTIMKPIEWVIDKVIAFADAIRALVANNPELVKIATVGVTIGGVFLLLAGIALKATSAFSGVSLMMLTMGKSFSSMGGLIRSGSLKILGTLLPLTLKLGLLAFMWKNDFAGIRTSVTSFVNNLTTSFRTARQAVDGSVSDLVSTLEELKNKDDFFSKLTIGIMRVMMLFKALADGWNDYALSEDNFLKAKELGILPLVEALLDLKYRFGYFKQGFLDGWREIGDKVRNVIGGIANSIDGTVFEKLFNGFTSFIQSLANNDPKAWENAGEVFSKLTASIVGLVGAFKLFKGISKIFGAGKSIGGFIGGLLGKGKGSGGSSGGGLGGGLLSNPKAVAKNMASIAIILGSVGGLILALGMITSIPHFSDFMSNGADTILTMFSVLVPITASVAVLGLLVKAIDKLKISPSQALKGIANFAIILGGLELIIVALGAIISVPYFSDFLSRGANVMSQIASVLGTIFSLEVIGSMALISAFGLVPIPAVLMGIANLALVLTGLTALILAFGALSKINGFNDFIESGGDTLALLFEQVGKIAGSFVGGIGEGITNSLPAMGENLSAFAQKLQPFFTILGSADLDSISEFAKAIGAFMLELGGQQLMSIFTGKLDLVALGTQLSDFAKSASGFFTQVASYPQEGFDKAKLAFESLSGMSNYSFKTGGLAQLFTGSTSMGTIGQQLADFAPHGATFFNAVASYSASGIAKAKSVFEAISGIGDYDFKTGGLAQLFTGSTDLSTVGSQLSSFADEAKHFFDVASTIPEAGIKNGATMLDVLSDIKSFKTGGLVELFTGGFDLVSLGSQLSDFATASKTFFDTVAQIDVASYGKSALMFKALSSAGSIVDVANKSKGQLNVFGIELVKFADNIASFAEKISGIGDMSGGLSNINTALSSFSTEFSGVASDMNSQVTTMTATMDNLSTAVTSRLSAMTTSVSSEFNKMGGNMQTGVDSINDRVSSVTTTVQNMTASITTSVQNMVTTVTASISNVTTTISNMGMTISSVNTTISGVTTTLNNMSSALDSMALNSSTKVKDAIAVLSSEFSKAKTSVETNVAEINRLANTLTANLSTSISTFSTDFGNMRMKMQSDVNLVTVASNTMASNLNYNLNAMSTGVRNMVVSVSNNLDALSAKFSNLRLQLPHVKVPHFSLVGDFNIETKQVPSVSVSWYQKGGVFNKPSVIGVGENGQEAVMPLEKNTGWIGQLAGMLISEMSTVTANLIPSNVTNNTSNTGDTNNQKYLTNNNTSNNTNYSDVDNSVTFAQGAIQLTVQNASEEEAMRLAQKVMEYIKRQQELDRMTSYA